MELAECFRAIQPGDQIAMDEQVRKLLGYSHR